MNASVSHFVNYFAVIASIKVDFAGTVVVGKQIDEVKSICALGFSSVLQCLSKLGSLSSVPQIPMPFMSNKIVSNFPL